MSEGPTMGPSPWRCLLELDARREPVVGDRRGLCAALARGADLRIHTEWRFEEHVAPDLGRPAATDESGWVQEVIDFRETILLDEDYAAAVTTLRQPILPIAGFNPNAGPRMSFFRYDVEGRQGCASLRLDPEPPSAPPGARDLEVPRDDMPKLGQLVRHDADTAAPSTEFVYDFERYRFLVRDDWRAVLAHEADGTVSDGAFAALHEAHHAGCELKLGLRDLAGGRRHEVLTPIGTSWVHTARGCLEALTHPLVRIRGARPLAYGSGTWDVAWVYARTDGSATVRRLDPYTRTFSDSGVRLACRWFAR